MKQFVQQNLFIVVMVAVVVVALGGVGYAYVTIDGAREKAAELETLKRELDAANASAESPEFVSLNKDRIHQIKQAQEKVIETILLFGTRQPLVGDQNRVVFPVPENVDLFAFRNLYLQSLPQWNKLLDAASMPTQQEIGELAAQNELAQLGSGEKIDKPALLKEAEKQIVDERATKSRLWVNPDSFDNYFQQQSMSVTRPTADQLWEAQLNWWIQDDLAKVVAKVNKMPITRPTADGSVKESVPANVRQSPIKELVWVEVNEKYYRGKGNVAGRGAAAEAANRPVLTGHVTCDRYDVIHYSFQVVMDVRQLPALVGALSTRNFHTVLSVDYGTLETKGRVAAGGRGGVGGRSQGDQMRPDYGPDPVMVATFQCEVVFMKSPQSWRGSKDDALDKRREFFRKHPELVLKVLQIKGRQPVELLNYKDLLAERVKLPGGQMAPGMQLKKLLAQTVDGKADPSLRFVGLYEDLIPPSVRPQSPGLDVP